MRLTLPQKQIYYMEMFNEDAVNINCGSVLLDKLYDVRKIEKAINEVFRINEALRTKIYINEGKPYQRFSEYTEKTVEILHFNSKAEVHEYGKKQAQVPMNLFGALCEIKIISSEKFCGVFYKVHHIISDAATFSLISSQIHKLLEGETVEAFPYSDYIAEEKKYISGKRYQKDKSFFLQQHDEMKELVYFSDVPPSRGKSERIVYSIDREQSCKIKQFAANKEVSEYTVFLTAVSAYIAKRKNYSGNFYIGTPVLNRSSVNEMNMAGMFVNNVPFPVNIEENKSFDLNLEITKDKFFKVLKHQKFNYVCALNELNLDQSYDVSLSFQNSTIYGEKFKSTWYHNGVQSESLQIHIDDRDNEGIFNISYDYHIERFSEKDVYFIHNHLINLLFDAIDNPGKKICELEMLSAYEKNKVLCDFNNTKADYNKNKCVHQIFEEHTEKTPDKIAIVASDKTLTYKALNEEANRIAHSLTEKGIVRGDVVAFKLRRRSYLISAVLGILKAGAAYLPIDPDFPQDRIEYMLSDSDAKYCITEKNIFELLNNTNSVNLKRETNSSDLCYCIYTSGSTGRPKGALITHRNVVNLCNDTPINKLQSYISSECAVVLASGSVIFDISSFEIILSLLLNKGIVFADEDEVSDGKLLAALIQKNHIDCVHCTPTKLNTYLHCKEFSSAFGIVKCVMVAGERLTKDVYDSIRNYSTAKIFNGYGPTETTMGVSFGEIENDSITIGKPIANTQIYILDKYMKPVPVGVTGEICIAGDCIGAGYLNRPELTAEKFIDNPFGEDKMYKTGDLAYWREDGNIIFVGRKDFQVKIRGLRIELGEIENTISNIDGINMSVVVVRKDSQDRQLICAFYTGEEKSSREIREKIGEKLPKYMIPHIFTHLEEIPLTPSGKTNRNALPEINLENIRTSVEYVASDTKKEKVLEEVVCTVLNLSTVSMLDNFFDVGGDSIKAIYIVSALEEKGYELQVSDIMQKDTFSDIAKAMKEISDRVVYSQGEVNGFIPFTPIMRAYIKDNCTISKDFVHTCVLSADCDEITAKEAIDALVSHHDILRGTFCDGGIEIHSSDEREVYSFRSVCIDDEEEAKEYLKDAKLSEDKLVNVVFCSTSKENLISITVHHFLIDLVSWEIIINDLQAAVKQLKNKEQISLPSKTASFILWNMELHKYSGRISQECKEYWKDVNEKLKDTKSLHSDGETVNEAETYSCVFDKDIADRIIYEVKKTYNTKTNEVLLTALGLAACKIAGGSVGIAVESHGRTGIDKVVSVDRTVGWFTSCFPVVIDSEKDVNRALISVKENLRKISGNGIDYLLMSQGLPENTEIIFNFYENSIADKTNRNNLIAFNSGSSAFSEKISVNCIITNGIMTVNISVPKSIHKKDICKELGVEFYEQAMKIVGFSTQDSTVIRTPSDFSDDELTETELDELIDLFEWTDIDEEQ